MSAAEPWKAIVRGASSATLFEGVLLGSRKASQVRAPLVVSQYVCVYREHCARIVAEVLGDLVYECPSRNQVDAAKWRRPCRRKPRGNYRTTPTLSCSPRRLVNR